MDPPICWNDVVCSTQSWIPGQRLPKWSRKKIFFVRCQEASEDFFRGVIVDCQLPSLGQTPENRSLVSTMEGLKVHHGGKSKFLVGCTYVFWGTLCPVWHADEALWHVQVPANTDSSGCARFLGGRPVARQVKALELCAGGMGGWSSALQAFQDWDVTVAIDNDAEMLKNFAYNHDFRFMNLQDFLRDPETVGPAALLADLMENGWLSVTMHNDMDVWLVSFPCQSWSSMGHGSGICSDSGRVLLRILQAARVVQPLYILFENVAGFRQHPEYPQFCKTMEECGFALAASVIHDLARLSYTTRRRWLAVYVNTLRVEHWPSLGRMMPTLCYDEETYDPQLHCTQALTAMQRHALEITPEEFQVLNDPSLLPSWQRAHALPKRDALSLRTCSRGHLFPVISASYRTAVSFSAEYLRGKGLMAWPLQDNRNQVRWLGKWEAARALAFPSGTILPSDEFAAFHALGNAISPLHAAFAVHHCSEVMKQQAGRPYLTTFSQVVRKIKAERADLSTLFPSMFSTTHEQLQLPGPIYDLCQLCPHCGWLTQYPLVIACQQCSLVACRDCVTQQCEPGHFAVPAASQQPRPELEHLEGAQFSVKHLFHGDPQPMSTSAYQDLRQVRAALSLPDSATFFLGCDAVLDSYRPKHNDSFIYAEIPVGSSVCTLCKDDVFGMAYRFCPLCKRLGCSSCVADSCNRCAKGQMICRECHLNVIREAQNASHEEIALQIEDQVNASKADFEWATACPLQKQAAVITVVLYPNVVAYAATDVYADCDRLLALVASTPAGAGQIPQSPVFFWGNQRKPSKQAGQAHVLIVPEQVLQPNIVPVLFFSAEGLEIRLLQAPVSAEQCYTTLLTQDEIGSGCQLKCDGQIFTAQDEISVGVGQVLERIPPWSVQKRRCGYGDSQSSLGHDILPPTQRQRHEGRQDTSSTLEDTQTFQTQSTVIGLDGRPLQTPPLVQGSSWTRWLQDLTDLPPLHQIWATIDGRPIHSQQPLPQEPFVLRLRYRLHGGARSQESLIKKLQEHLQAKGVPKNSSPMTVPNKFSRC